jgi:MFS family permease
MWSCSIVDHAYYRKSCCWIRRIRTYERGTHNPLRNFSDPQTRRPIWNYAVKYVFKLGLKASLLAKQELVAQMGIVSGPVFGGLLTQYASWRWCFYINLPIGAVASVLLLSIKIPDRINRNDSEKPTILGILSKLDLIGFGLFAPWATMLLLALQWGGTEFAWNSATIIGLFCGAGGMFFVFAAWEYRIGDGAMIPFPMLRIRVVWCSCLVVLFFFGMQVVTTYYLPIYFQAVKGVSPSLSGVYLLPSILTMMAMAVVSGILGEYAFLWQRVDEVTNKMNSWEAWILFALGSR